MISIFSEMGLRYLDRIVQPGILCVFDFDGTLSPIVLEHERASLPISVLRRLIKLARHTPVAVITGRSVADISKRIGFKPHYLVGNHGLEGVPGWEEQSAEYILLCQAWKKTLLNALQNQESPDPGIRIEDKQYSLSIHYRLARNRDQAEHAIAALLKSLVPPPRIITGKYVYNLLPQDATDKGRAFEQLLHASGAPSALYVGDDVTDEDVFRVHLANVISIRIERDENSAAEFFLHHRPDIVQLLDELIKRLSQQGQNRKSVI